MPVKGYITSPFGKRISPVTNKEEFHNGIDIAAGMGTGAYAVADGKVTKAGSSRTWGNYIQVEIQNGYSIFYAHLSEVLMKKGDSVKGGDIIAKTGSTGRSTGPHLHFTLYYNGAEIDPAQFFTY